MRNQRRNSDLNRCTRIAPVCLVVMGVACEGPGTGAPGYTVVDSGGVRIVESSAPAWAEGAYRIDPEPLARIGREEAGPYQFAAVAAGALLPDGRIVVADAGAQEVRLFDSSGQHVRTFGGAGDGPGEFRGLSRVFDYPGDSLTAFDGRRYRTTVFSTMTGSYRTIQNQVEGNFGVFGLVGDGPFLLYSAGGGYRPDLSPGLQWVFTDIVAMDPAHGSSRVIANLPDRLRRVASDGNAPMPQPLHYAAQAVAEDGFYWGTPDAYDIGFYGADGLLRQIVRRPVEPGAVEPAMIEQFIEAQLERVRRFEGEDAVPRYRAGYEEGQYGEHLPLFQSAFVDQEDRLWVGSSEWPVGRWSRLWSVFSPEGYWLGDLEAPEGVRIVDASGDTVLGIWRDAFDVPHVRIHRLIGGSRER